MARGGTGHLWAVVLAGGDGRRVAAFTRDATGGSVPKQYSRAFGDVTLLERALRRARRLVPATRVVVVVAAPHRRWWGPLLDGIPPENVLEQPDNRGTAPGVLLPVRWLRQRDRAARMLVLPSDHYVRDEGALGESLVDAVDAIHRDDSRLVLVGMVGAEADTEYGWIVPGPAEGALSRVAAFCEKPRVETARGLVRRGALVNTLIFGVTAATLGELFARTAPELDAAFDDVEQELSAPAGSGLAALYCRLGSTDFSRVVLEQAVESLWVLRSRPCGWTDLGTPTRLAPFRRELSAAASGSAG